MGTGVRYSDEFRADAVRQVVEYSRPVREVAEIAGVHEYTLRRWIRRARQEGLDVTAKNHPNRSREELADEIQQLRAEMKSLRRELATEQKRVEFLKKAASFFVAEQFDPTNGSK